MYLMAGKPECAAPSVRVPGEECPAAGPGEGGGPGGAAQPGGHLYRDTTVGAYQVIIGVSRSVFLPFRSLIQILLKSIYNE